MALAVLFSAAPASAQINQIEKLFENSTWQLATGVDYTSGRYGASSDTTVLSIPFIARVQVDRLRLEASIPWLDVKGPGVFTGGIVVGGSGATSRRSGIGDLNLGAAWLARNDDTSFPAIEFEGLVKVPTAKSGIGTGKADYTAQVNLYHSLTSRLMLFGTVGYQWLSNFQTYTLENGVLASGGVNARMTANTDIGASLNYRQEYYHGLGNSFSMSPYILWKFYKNWRVSAYGIVGTTDASPDYGAGMRLIFSG